MWKVRTAALFLLALGVYVGYFVYSSEQTQRVAYDSSEFGETGVQEVPANRPFKLGLDLAGGSHLIYRADTSLLESSEVAESMNTLRDVIERRVNLFGVAEPIVQVEQSGVFSGVREERLIVELPGVTDLGEAVRLIGETPVLDFRLLLADAIEREDPESGDFSAYTPTSLTGRFLKRAVLDFGSTHQGQLSNEAVVILEFDGEGADLFSEITRENVGNVLAIFLDGIPISTPVIREEIPGGRATITGGFSPDEARELVRNLNFGALPVPIELIGSQTIGSTLGSDAVRSGVVAGVVGLALVAGFLLLWYRLPGILAVVSLTIYVVVMLALFKLIPITLTAAGAAGFILSIGLAVDANILIFERMKEELRAGRDATEAVRHGFARAWLPIRDGNISSVITAVVLFWFGTSIVEGFALTFGIGILVSMLTAITVTRTFLYALGLHGREKFVRFLFGSGVRL
jgi:preprotein translocase subunit SecD